MFCVLFELCPRPGQQDAYFGYARSLRPHLAGIDGFIDNTRYRSLRRAGWFLSCSTWRDEKALVRWRTHAVHHAVQDQGRRAVFADYRLRVGQVTADTHIPFGQALCEQRLDRTEAGTAKTLSIIEAPRPAELSAEALRECLGLAPDAPGLTEWDVFEAVPEPATVLLLAGFGGPPAPAAGVRPVAGVRRRRLGVIRDYGMFRRYEAPQFHAPIAAA